MVLYCVSELIGPDMSVQGSIERGKLADVTVLSKNLLKVAPKEILNTDVLYTIVAGKVVHQK